MSDSSKLLNQRQAAEILSLSERTLESMRLRRVGPRFLRLSSRCLRYRTSDLLRWLEECEITVSERKSVR